eukprot:4835997-Pyramimonas_sp.AAC.1
MKCAVAGAGEDGADGGAACVPDGEEEQPRAAHHRRAQAGVAQLAEGVRQVASHAGARPIRIEESRG